MATTRTPGAGAPHPGTHTKGGSTVTIGADGRIAVKPGDTISRYAQALYGDPLRGWEEFGRIRGVILAPLDNPDKIAVGETLYHLPTAGTQALFTTTALDMVEVHRFLHSVAWRTAFVQSARLVWNNEKGSFLKQSASTSTTSPPAG